MNFETMKRNLGRLAAGLTVALAASNAQAAAESFLLNVSDPGSGISAGTWGKVTFTQASSTTLHVDVVLYGGAKFVDTGNADYKPGDPHTAFVFNLKSTKPASEVQLQNITSGFGLDPYLPDNQTPFGSFSEGLACTGCGKGGSNPLSGPLSFDVVDATGLSLSDLFPTDKGFFVSADLLAGGKTGNVGGNRVVPAIPEPETYAMILAGLGLMGAVVRRRRRQSAS